jgi:hypothetical protein
VVVYFVLAMFLFAGQGYEEVADNGVDPRGVL